MHDPLNTNLNPSQLVLSFKREGKISVQEGAAGDVEV